MGDGPQASEETAVPHLLKVALTHVLSTHDKDKSEGSLVVFIVINGTVWGNMLSAFFPRVK